MKGILRYVRPCHMLVLGLVQLSALAQSSGWYRYQSHQVGEWCVRPGNDNSTLMALGYSNRIDVRIINAAGDSTSLLRFSSPLDIWPFVIDVGQLPGGDFFIFCRQRITSDLLGFSITRFNANADIIWSRGLTSQELQQTGESYTTFGKAEGSNDTFKLLLAGITYGFTAEFDGDGNYLRSTTYSTVVEINGADTTFQPIRLRGMCTSDDGSTTFISHQPYLIHHCSPNGEVLWSKRFSMTQIFVPYELELLSEGDVLVGASGDHRAVLAKITSTGSLEWTNSYSTPGNDIGVHGVRSIIQASNGDVFFCAPIADPLYVHLDTTGAPMAAYSANFWGLDVPFDMVSSDGTSLKLGGITNDISWYGHDMFGTLDVTSDSDCALHQVSISATPEVVNLSDTSIHARHIDVTILPLEPTLTSVSDTVHDGCSVFTALPESSLPSRFSVYPTLLTNGTTVSIEAVMNERCLVVVRDALGRERSRHQFHGRTDVATSGLAPGTYHVECQDSHGSTAVVKLIIQ